MNAEESRQDMQRLGSRIQSSRDLVETKTAHWSAPERQQFFDDFSQSPVLEALNRVGPDPIARLQLFLTMSDSDLERLMTLQACVARDAQEGGTMGTQVSQMATGGATGAGGGGFLGGIAASLGALTGLGGGGSGGHDHSHSHGHDHPSPAPIRTSVTSGTTETMER
jgi:hypothetical protein